MNKVEKQARHDHFRQVARAMFFSKETVETFLGNATFSQVDAVTGMLDHEAGVRECAKRSRLMRRARFPVLKSFDTFDFTKVGFPDGYTKEDMLTLGFVERSQDFVFFGKTGRGKTHAAIALGLKCIDEGYSARFFSTAELVLALGKAKREEKLDALLKELGKADVVILDEFGYVPLDIDGARLLYQVISNSYETRSIIFTTNIEFSRWGTVFADEKLAASIVDRIVHHGRLVEFGGTSRRMDESLMLGKTQ